MNSLYIQIFCISWIYFGPLLGYPIQGTDYSADFPREHRSSEHKTKSESAEVPTVSFQMSRLIDIYNDLLLADQEDVISDLIRDADDRDNVEENSHIGNSYGSHLDVIDSNDPKRVASVIRPLESERPKRQQGWYIQYGKRNSRAEFPTKDAEHHPKSSHHPDQEYATNKDILSSLLQPTELGIRFWSNKPQMFKTAALSHESHNAKDYSTNEQLNPNDPDGYKLKENELQDLEQESQTEKMKRQQGWFISYGKRSDNDRKVYFI